MGEKYVQDELDIEGAMGEGPDLAKELAANAEEAQVPDRDSPWDELGSRKNDTETNAAILAAQANIVAANERRLAQDRIDQARRGAAFVRANVQFPPTKAQKTIAESSERVNRQDGGSYGIGKDSEELSEV